MMGDARSPLAGTSESEEKRKKNQGYSKARASLSLSMVSVSSRLVGLRLLHESPSRTSSRIDSCILGIGDRSSCIGGKRIADGAFANASTSGCHVLSDD